MDSQQKYEIVQSTSTTERRLLALAYLGSSSLMLVGGYAISPVKRTFLFYDRLFTLLNIWDEPLPVFATTLTWVGVLFAVLMLTARW